MDKTNGHVQILDSHLFFSPNCSRTVDLPIPAWDRNGCEHNIFLPYHQPDGCCNHFDLDIAQYAIPCWWSLPFSWIAFFPLYPSFSRPIFEKLILPANHRHVFDEECCEYLLSSGLSKKWLQVENDLSNAVYIIHCHNKSTFLPPAASSSGPKSVIWVEFFTHCQKNYEEHIQKETPQQKQAWLSCLANPPKLSTKVFEWVVNDDGNFIWQAIPKKMCEMSLMIIPPVRSTMTQLRMNMTAARSITPAPLEKHQWLWWWQYHILGCWWCGCRPAGWWLSSVC